VGCERGPRPQTGPEPAVADLLYTVHHPSGDQIVLKDERYSTFLRYDTTYRFRLVVTAEGEGAVEEAVVVRFGAAWDEVEVLGE
jgi:hypothetical protein